MGDLESSNGPNEQFQVGGYDKLAWCRNAHGVAVSKSGVSYRDGEGKVVFENPPMPDPVRAEVVFGNREKIVIRYYGSDGTSGDIRLKEEKFPKAELVHLKGTE
jgi:hypothetical protein